MNRLDKSSALFFLVSLKKNDAHELCSIAARLQLVEERSELLVIEFYPR